MLDVKLLRENLDQVKARMATRGGEIDWDEFVVTRSRAAGRTGEYRTAERKKEPSIRRDRQAQEERRRRERADARRAKR